MSVKHADGWTGQRTYLRFICGDER